MRSPKPSEPSHIDENVIAAHFVCQRKSFLLLRHRTQTTELLPQTAYAQVLDAQATKAKTDYLQTLQRENERAAFPINGSLEDGEVFLLDTVIEAGGFQATCALLRKVHQPPSDLGRYSYEPTLFVGSHTVSGEHITSLACVAHALGKRQGVMPKTGIVVTADVKLHRIRLPSLERSVQPAIEAAKNWSANGFRDEPSVVINKHCPTCSFRLDCEQRAIEKDDLSLLHRMTPKIMKRYHKKGIFTVNQLSYVFRPRRNRKNPRHATRHFNVELQALAIRTQKIYLHETPQLQRSPVEIFLDIEGVPDRRFHYLIGLLIVDRQTNRYLSFWADAPGNDEKRIWSALLATANEHPDAPVYHYGTYEPKAIADLELRHGGNAAKLKGRLVNITTHIFGNIYFPVRSNGLKDIGHFIGARWRSDNASGLQSLVWRHQWEENRDPALKQRLVEYNEDDCVALRMLAERIGRVKESAAEAPDVEFSHRPKQLSNDVSRPIHAEFTQILKSAHLVYKSRRIKIRSGDAASPEPGDKPKRIAKPKQPLGRIKTVPVPPKRMCPNHRGEVLGLSKKRIGSAVVTDLVFSGNGCRKSVTKYVGPKAYCFTNSDYYNPPQISRLGGRRFGDGFHAWVAYSRVVLRLPYDLISHVARDLMGIQAPDSTLVHIFREVSERYMSTQKHLERRIAQSEFVHADETRLNIRGRDQYVWVFTDGERVAFRLTETRESTVVQEFLAGYQGVLISDFYPGYDGVPCRQQKCLVHLIRDINNDLWKNPFDVEFEAFVVAVRDLIVPVVQTVHRYGLKSRYLRKFERDVERFYKRSIDGREYRSESANKFQKRFDRYRDSLFVFLGTDGIPWENNMAERALRQLAVQRKISGFFYEDGALQYMRLLGLSQTCRFQEKSFLRFLLSGERDIDEFKMKGRQRFVWPQH